MESNSVVQALVELEAVCKRFGEGGQAVQAIDALTAQVQAGQVTGLVGPDGAGKTTLMRLIAGLLMPDGGQITVAGFDSIRDVAESHQIMGYMPQRFGLYEDLTVAENLTLYADLRNVAGKERTDVFARLLEFTGLESFRKRLAGNLSGGMKQKLGLACTLVKKPQILLLDEPSVGVDPLSRRELWKMVYELVDQGIGVLWSTAYLDEAERCASVLLLNEGRLLYAGPPGGLTHRVEGRVYAVSNLGTDKRKLQSRMERLPGVIDALIQGSTVRLVMDEGHKPPALTELDAGASATIQPVDPRFEDAFITMLSSGGNGHETQGNDRKGLGADTRLNINGYDTAPSAMVTVDGLTRRFGDFTAVNDLGFDVKKGEIFGLLGPNGAGKSTTFKMLCGLLPPSEGLAQVAGIDLGSASARARARIGYMAQKFSLYGDLSVRQNFDFFSGVYGLAGTHRRQRIDEMVEIFDLSDYLDTNTGDLPLGFKQRLSLACAIMHEPVILFLDEPTSGVDPLTRREFWGHINTMVQGGMTVLVTTHFLDEAEYCDRIALMYRASLIALGSPEELKGQAEGKAGGVTLEDAFIHLVEDYDIREGRG